MTEKCGQAAKCFGCPELQFRQQDVDAANTTAKNALELTGTMIDIGDFMDVHDKVPPEDRLSADMPAQMDLVDQTQQYWTDYATFAAEGLKAITDKCPGLSYQTITESDGAYEGAEERSFEVPVCGTPQKDWGQYDQAVQAYTLRDGLS